MRDAPLVTAGRRLVGTVFEPADAPPPGPALLFLHGLNSNQRGYLPRARAACSELGAVCLTFDLGGHGASDGDLDELTPRDHLDEAVTAFDYLGAGDGVDASRIGVCAASYGSYLAGWLASRRPVARLLLRAPALYHDADMDTPLGRRRTSTPQAGAVFDGVRRLGNSVLILESEHDELIPHGVVNAYLEACPEARHDVIPGATHALTEPQWREAFMEAMLDWFRNL